jgi:hypothetical protein
MEAATNHLRHRVILNAVTQGKISGEIQSRCLLSYTGSWQIMQFPYFYNKVFGVIIFR